MSAVRRIVPLTVGSEQVPKSLSVHGDTSGEILVEPVPAIALDTGDGWTLIDTGFNTALIRDPPLRRRLHGEDPQIGPILPAGSGEPLVDALAAHGIALTDIARIYISHLHNDHAGGLRLFDARVPVFIQRAELEFGLSRHPQPEQHGIFRIDFDDPRIDWRLLDGDAQLAPSVEAVFTPGHTPGHMSFLVELAGGGGCAFACDAADLTQNIDRERGPGGFVDCEPQDALDSLLRLKAIAARRGLPLVPGHDPVAWPALTAELA